MHYIGFIFRCGFLRFLASSDFVFHTHALDVILFRSLGRFKHRFIKLYMLIGLDFVHFVYDNEAREMLAAINDTCGIKAAT